ncbi:hypothetical protein FMK91_05480 [Klebsiella grimontii]|uniref:hypothetical protein n=1 Tax=Klebsiella grimontii TaxID=2058152 RepID=UPI001CCF60CF|nr:hypothetical protein [Klebsiella grimontii]MBZ7441666.1 hypothetical protein [Klebsiella grimontii]
MAAICLDYKEFTSNSIDFIDAYPKIENQVGDIPYIPEDSRVLILTTNIKRQDRCLGLKVFSVVLVLTFGAIVGLLGGKVMYYIPLYVALTPVVYWLLKIVYAYYVVKIKKLHVDSEVFSGKTHG